MCPARPTRGPRGRVAVPTADTCLARSPRMPRCQRCPFAASSRSHCCRRWPPPRPSRRPTPTSSPRRRPSSAATARAAAVAPKLARHELAPYVGYWQLKAGPRGCFPGGVTANSSSATRTRRSPIACAPTGSSCSAAAPSGTSSRSTGRRPRRDDVELACYGVLYRWQRDGDGALVAAKPLWFTEKATPDACDPAFAALIQRGDLTPPIAAPASASPARPAMCASRRRSAPTCRARTASPTASSAR